MGILVVITKRGFPYIEGDFLSLLDVSVGHKVKKILTGFNSFLI